MVFYNDLFYTNEDEFIKEVKPPDIIGKGIAYNNTFDIIGRTRVCEGIEKVIQSMTTILRVPEGSLFFNPNFGSKLHLLIFETNDLVLQDLASYYSKEALNKFEKRVVIDNVKSEVFRNIVNITIYFRIRNSNSPQSFVYSINREIPEAM